MRKEDALKHRLDELFSPDISAFNVEQEELSGSHREQTNHMLVTRLNRAGNTSIQELSKKRVQELDCLNEIGHRIDGKPDIEEFLTWVANRLPEAMQDPKQSIAAITYENKVYGDPKTLDLTSKIVAGLRINNELMGYIHIAYIRERHFLDEESAFIGAVAGRVSGYLENLHFLQQMRTRSHELSTLNEMSRSLTSILSIEQIAHFIYQFTARLMGVVDFFVAYFDEETQIIYFVYLFLNGQPIQPFSRPLGNGLSDRIIRNREPILLGDNVVTGMKELGIDFIPVGDDKPALSWLGVPILYEEKILGVISVQTTEMPGLYTVNELNLLTAIAQQAAVAMQNTLNYQKVKKAEDLAEKRSSDLEAVAQLSNRISSILEPDRLLQVVVDLSKEMFGLYHSHIYLFDEENGKLILAAGAGDIGKKMKEEGWSIDSKNEFSIVARAVRNHHGITVNDIQQENNFLHNALLPNTHAELAVPIIAADSILGVLDVQSEQAGKFQAEDVSIQTALAAQVAVALQNAWRYQEIQTTLAQLETLIEYAPEAIVIIDTETGKFTEPNKNAELLFGITHDRLLQVGPSDVSPAIQPDGHPSADTAQEMIEIALKGSAPIFDWVFLNSGGIEIPCDIRLVKLPSRDRKLVRASITDISERRKTELEREAILTETRQLYQGSAKIVASNSMQEVLAAIVEATTITKRFDQAHLLLFDRLWEEIPPGQYSIAGSWVHKNLEKSQEASAIIEQEQFNLIGVADPQQPTVILDIHLDKRVNSNLRRLMGDVLGMKSMAVFPLVVRNQFFGAITLQSKQKVNISDVEIRQINSLVSQGATVIQSQQLRENLQRQLQEMETLQRMLSSQAWTSYLGRQDRDQWGYEYNRVEIRPFSKNAISQGGNGRTKGRSLPEVSFTLPFEVHGEVIGGLGIPSNAAASLSEDEINFLNAVAEQVAQSLERARLFEKTQKSALELETVAQVSSASSTVLDPYELLQSVVDLAKNSFGLYHAHVYLLDELETQLVLAAGAGEVGRQMVKEGWAIFIDDDSIVAHAALTRIGQIVNNVRETPKFLPNPLLPNTASELAIPMVVGQKLLGVFDVQSNRKNAFNEDDLRTFTTLASQTAIALQNARLFAEQTITVERLRELDHLKTSFLANMSHELRTPLNSILGFTQVILEGIDGPLSDYMVSDLQLIEKNGKHLLNLINEVLDMAKIEAGRMSLTIEPVNLNELMEDVLETTSSQARDKAIFLELDAHEVDDFVINGDQMRLRQIMLNLVGNAIKFTDSGGITVRITQDSDLVTIQVQDTGLGIPEDKLENIFEAFSQVDTSTTRKVGGTGLGLPISRRLVEMHGGQLWAESNGAGNGTTMYMRLPIHAKTS